VPPSPRLCAPQFDSMIRTCLLLALLGLSAALPSAPLHLRTPQQQPMRLKGGWLNENQLLNTVAGLEVASGATMILLPKETLDVYGVKTQSQMERNSMQWFGNELIAVSILILAHNSGMSFFQSMGLCAAWSSLFMLWQTYATEGLVDLAKCDRKPFLPWIIALAATAVLGLTDGAGLGIDLNNVAKFWGLVFALQSVFVYFFNDTFLKTYGIEDGSRLMTTLGQSNAVFLMGQGIYYWLASEGNTKAEALLPMMTLAGIYFAKQVVTQEWRKVNAMHGVGPAFWMLVDSLLGYNLCRITRNKA